MVTFVFLEIRLTRRLILYSLYLYLILHSGETI